MSESVNKSGLVPKLRFPEFSEAWAAVPLGGTVSIISDRVGDHDCIPLSITSGVGLVSQVEKYGRTIAGSQYKNYIRLQNGDFAYNKSSTKSDPEGFIARYTGNAWAAVPNSIFTCFRVNAKLADPRLLRYFFEANLHGNFLRQRLSVGARAHGSLNIADADLLDTPIPLPQGDLARAEQRKVAECLESLDELIAAETEKLEASKQHWKGLLQQIFPAEGETIPRLRFPQFRNAGEWSYSLLEEAAENLDNRRIPISSSQRVRGGTPYYGASGIVDYVEGYIFDETLLCVSEDGANLVARSTPIAFTIEGQTWVNNHAHVLKFADRHIHALVEAYLNQMDLGDFLTGMAQPKLNRGMLDTIAIPLPSLQEEAAAVAEVIITAESGLSESAGRLKALHQHKDALMQQLFPSTEEIDDAKND